MKAPKANLHLAPSTQSAEATAAIAIGPMDSKSRPGGIPEMVNTQVAAGIIGRAPDTLKRWRYEGVGPEYIVFRGRVRYDVRVLVCFNSENTRMPSVRAAMEADREDF